MTIIGMSYQEKTGAGRRVAYGDLRFLAVLRVPDSGRAVRKLEPAVQRAAGYAYCRLWRLCRDLWLGSYENNVYAQIGLVMLIGLAAKNAILIVEFAKMGVEEGKPLVDATLEGARLRLRPILMTSFAFILGCVPLAIASGAGALSRQVMGFVVIGGMTAATVIAIFLIPVSFYVVEKWTHRGESAVPVKDKQEQDHE